MRSRLESLIPEVSGLTPESWIILGPGFVREELKTLCFQKRKAINAQAIQNPRQFAQALVPKAEGKILDRFARTQLLKECVKNSDLKAALPRILEHRFRPHFFETLDRTLEQGRSFFANLDEAQVFHERLTEKRGFDEKREEFFLLNRFWERLLEVRELWDEARLFEDATEVLRNQAYEFPVKKIVWLEHLTLTPRVRFFREELSRAIPLEIMSANETNESARVKYSLAHSLEDIAHFILDEVIAQGGTDSHALVIEDRPEVRRTIRRVAMERGIPLLDPRDPTLIHQSEEVKSSLLELELVAKDFPRELVLNYWSIVSEKPGEMRKWIIDRGIVSGLESYKIAPELYSRLIVLKERFPGRVGLDTIEKEWLLSIRNLKLAPWVDSMATRVIESMRKDANLLKTSFQKKPLRMWLTEIEKRLRESSPIADPSKNKKGLRLHRVDQAVSLTLPEKAKIHFMGVSSSFFESRDEGGEWFSPQDLEALSSEFELPSRQIKAAQAKKSFAAWVGHSAGQAFFYESSYNERGDELDTATLSIKDFIDGEVQVLDAHSGLIHSMTGKLKRGVKSDSIKLTQTEFPVSFMNAYGSCPFTALAGYLLSLNDERDPDFELDRDIYGTLIHRAIEILLKSNGKKPPLDSFREAWSSVSILGWVKSERMYRSFERNAVQLLEKFLENEREFQEFAKTEPLYFENSILLEREGLKFKGRVDRVDQHADGLVVIDYKTSAKVPSARETLEKGKGLQMPLYALAIRESQKVEVVGAQYMTLKPEKVSRNAGFLFKQWNKGTKKDEVEAPLSKARSNSPSLVFDDPDTTWKQMDERIKILIQDVKMGKFEANPADPKDCSICRYARVCGVNRGVIRSPVGDAC